MESEGKSFTPETEVVVQLQEVLEEILNKLCGQKKEDTAAGGR